MNDTSIVYYSRTGTTRQAAQILGERLGCPVFEIADRESRAGAWGDLRCVIDNLLRRRVDYRYTGIALDDCSVVIVMAPVWIGHLAAPMRSFLKDHRAWGQRLAAIAVMAARGGFRAAEEIAVAAGRPPHPVLVLLQRDVADGSARQKLDEFAAMLETEQRADGAGQRSAWLSPHEA